MNYLRERVSYLKGLAEGMNLDDSTSERKLLKAIIDVLDDIALAVDDIEEVQEHLSDQVDSIDEDMAEIESILFDEDDYEGGLGEFLCPHCNERIVITEDMLDREGKVLVCPNCNRDIEVEWECDCEECDQSENKKKEK
ncbi:MAG: CD1247 N-terminal domain-containing protein [Acetivibrionales bacterium]|jgi:hypothetical protein